MICRKIGFNRKISAVLFVPVLSLFFSLHVAASEVFRTTPSNFVLPGIIDLPTARRFPDGELIVAVQIFSSNVAFRALPRLGVTFRYTGHGVNGMKHGRINHDEVSMHTLQFGIQHYLPFLLAFVILLEWVLVRVYRQHKVDWQP